MIKHWNNVIELYNIAFAKHFKFTFIKSNEKLQMSEVNNFFLNKSL